MKINIKSLYILCVFFTFLISCEKDSTDLHKEKINYSILVNDNNSSLVKVNLYTKTYYPEENETIINSFGKSKYRNAFDDLYLTDFDSLGFSPDLLGYKGCHIYMEVNFFYHDSLDLEPELYVINDTISNNYNVLFSWPEDTAKFTKL